MPSAKCLDRLYIVGGFVIVHFIFYALGGEFNFGSVYSHYQFLDVEFLKNGSFADLRYLHSQPPLLNLQTAIFFRLGGEYAPLLAQTFMVTLGLLACLSIHDLLSNLGLSRRAALGAIFFLLASPAFLLYEHYYFYAFMVGSLFSFAAWFLQRWSREENLFSLAGFASAMTFISLLRSSYHLVFLGLIYFIVWMASRSARKRPAAGILTASLALVFAWYAKNLIIFGFFGPSSWMGMNFVNKVVSGVSQQRQELAVQEEGLSSYLVFRSIAEYPPVKWDRDFPNISILTAEEKSNGLPNLNHAQYVPLSAKMGKEAIALAKKHPEYYLNSVVTAAGLTFFSATNYPLLGNNTVQFKGWLQAYDKIIQGAFLQRKGKPFGLCLFLLAAYALTLAFMARRTFFDWKAKRFSEMQLPLFCLTTMLFSLSLGVALETGENNRFRVEIEPLFYLFFCLGIFRLYHYARSAKALSGGKPPLAVNV